MEKSDKLAVIAFLSLVAFLLFALFAACSVQAAEKKESVAICMTPTPVYFEPLGYDFMERQIRNAVAFWNNKLRVHVLVYVGRKGMGYKYKQYPRRYIGIRSATSYVLKKWRTEPGKRGTTRPGLTEPELCRMGSAIWIDTSCITPKYERGSGCLPREFLYRLIIHELGHALGLPHAEERGTIMYPNLALLPTKIKFAEETLDEIKRLYPDAAVRGKRYD